MQQVQRAGFYQEQRLTQRMNTQLIQSIKLMELPVMDLRERIAEELERNPALEVLEDKSVVSLDGMQATHKESDDYFEQSSDSGFTRQSSGQAGSDAKQQFMEGTLTHAETLQEHLLWQLRLQCKDNTVKQIAEILIQNLGSDGFNLVPLDEIKQSGEYKKLDAAIKINKQQFNWALQFVRSLEPQGCAASDYKESLAVQAELKYPEDAGNIIKIIPYLELLKHGKFSAVASKLDIGTGEVQELYNDLKTLSPFPGRTFNSAGNSDDTVRFIAPDVEVVRRDGGFAIILNEEEIPVLGLQPFFLKQAKSKTKGADRDYVRENLKEARWFIQSINKRNHTLLRVTRAIVNFQAAFFSGGPKYLAPLTLHDIAEEIKVHETTVSRCANGKYMQTEWGIFQLRYFFTNAIDRGLGAGSDTVSQAAVTEIIREIINTEERRLSDQKIADMLKERGINIARRTVAKYRTRLDMDSSYKR